MATNEWGYTVLCTALTVVDDTSLVSKVVIAELKVRMAVLYRRVGDSDPHPFTGHYTQVGRQLQRRIDRPDTGACRAPCWLRSGSPLSVASSAQRRP
eukprot:scaffold43528_cov24-Tisochrysis_lutea.AAC.2